jgi:hypothetical protein
MAVQSASLTVIVNDHKSNHKIVLDFEVLTSLGGVQYKVQILKGKVIHGVRDYGWLSECLNE